MAEPVAPSRRSSKKTWLGFSTSTNPQEAFIGEIGLIGEIRRVTRIEQRINEAAKLGFTKIYAPKNSLHGMKIPEGIKVVGVTTVGEVLKTVFS